MMRWTNCAFYVHCCQQLHLLKNDFFQHPLTAPLPPAHAVFRPLRSAHAPLTCSAGKELEMIVRFGVWITIVKNVFTVYLMRYNTPLKCSALSAKTQTRKRSKTRGFSRCPNPGFGFGKMSGLPGYPGFSKPGFQSLLQTCWFYN